MMEELTGRVMEEDEEKEKMQIPQQFKNKTGLFKQGSPDSTVSTIQRDYLKRNRQQYLIYNERLVTLLEISVLMKRTELTEVNNTIASKESHMEMAKGLIERDNYSSEESLKMIERKSTVARTLFEKERKTKEERNAVIEKSTDKIRTIKSELAETEEILNNYKRCRNILFKLAPPEWQEAQEAEALKARVLSDRAAQDEQSRDPQESAVRQGLEGALESSPGRALPSTEEPTVSSAHRDTMIKTSKLDSDSSECEEKLELYFSDSHQLQDLVTELTEQNLSLIQGSTRVDEILEELQQSIESTLKKKKEHEEKVLLQVSDKRDRTDTERERGVQLKKMVQLHNSLKTEDQDIMLDDMAVKVTEVHCCCVDSRLTVLSTLEKLSSVEYRMSVLLQHIESIPEESLEALRQIKDGERRSRLVSLTVYGQHSELDKYIDCAVP
ncbi:cilia- and flagella-associated protein 100-like [Lates japonicus]